MVYGHDVSSIIYKRMYELAKVLDEKEFVARAEELTFILAEIRDMSRLPKTEN